MRTDTLGVAAAVDDGELNQYQQEVLDGITAAAADAGRATTVFPLADWQHDAARLAALCDGRVDGLILLAPRLERGAALPAQAPLVSVHANNELPGVLNLESDEEAGACEMVRCLLRLGHRRVLHVGGPRGALGAERRLAGYLRAHAEARLKPLPGHVVHADFTVESGREALAEWLQGQRRRSWPHAIFAANDAIAIGCLETLAAHGIRVPEDLSVVGFDDIALARSARLATVRQPLHALGRRAVELLLARIGAQGRQGRECQDPVPDDLVLPTELVFSHTLAQPRAGSLVVA